MAASSAPMVPLAPPPSAAARSRACGEELFPVAVFEAQELHELHSQLGGALSAPVRESLVSLTVVSAGRVKLDQRNLLMNPRRSEGLRGVFAAWLKGLLGSDWAQLSVELWGATCGAASGDFRALLPSGGLSSVAGGGVGAAAANRIPVASVHEALELTERMVGAIEEEPSFVAVGLEIRRHVLSLGCTFLISALWVDLGTSELLGAGSGLRGVRAFLQTLGGAVFEDGGVATRPHPLVEVLVPCLRGERALAVVVAGPDDDPAVRAASELARLLVAKVPAANPQRSLEATAVREGFARQQGAQAPLLSSGVFAACFREIRDPPGSPLAELLTGDIKVRSCGFPGRALPSLRPYMARFEVTGSIRRKLREAAELEMAEFEEKGWVAPGADLAAAEGGPLSSEPLYAQLADYFMLPQAELTTTTVRWFARSQDQADPLVRTISKIREDVTLTVALLPLCAVHPFNALRLLRLGAVHSLLSLLSDASSLAPGHGDAANGGRSSAEEPSPAEIAALVLAALAVFAPIRRFLVAQCIFELLAVAIRHPSSDRQLLVFTALLVRLCHEPEHRQKASEALAEALAEQLERQLARRSGASSLGTDGAPSASCPAPGALCEAMAAAAASLSPFIPVTHFSAAVRSLLGHLVGKAPSSFHHLACSLAASARRSSDLELSSFVPRLLSLVPLQAPEALAFHGGAAALLALCSHTAATTSLSRSWVASTGIAIMRRALRTGKGAFGSIRVCVPLAAAEREENRGEAKPQSQWYSEVEEKVLLQSTLRFTLRGAGLSSSLARPSTGGAALGEAGSFPPATPLPTLRQQRLHGLVQLARLSDLAESPNSQLFQERPQLRIAVCDEKAEVFLSISLLPVAHCEKPVFAVDDAVGGQLGLWLCEMPVSSVSEEDSSTLEAYEVKRRRHQLDLRPPVHASAASPGRTEHLVSVTLSRGLYTLVPFSSHEVRCGPAGPEAVRAACRSQACGCVDLNLAQASLWDRGSRFAAVSAWSEVADLEIFEAEPWHQRLVLDGELLAQSLPVWLCPSQSGGPIEVLICVGCKEDLGEDPASLRGSEPCLDLWPSLPHRRVRNERTGALRIHVPELRAGQPLRVSCLWQESIVPGSWSRKTPRLLVYSSGPLDVHIPQGPHRPLASAWESCCCGPPPSLAGRWQASALFAGSWTQGFSSGFGSLRNPQVALDILRPPGRGEELQLDFYLCIPQAPALQRKASQGGQEPSRPSAALTIFARQEEETSGHGAGQLPKGRQCPPERLVESQMRKELGSSKAVVGGYVTAQLILSGAEARQQLFAVLQNNDPHGAWLWQLRVLARIRPRSDGLAADEAPQGQAASACCGLGAPILSPSGVAWGRVVDEDSRCWHLDSGRTAEKSGEGQAWRWAEPVAPDEAPLRGAVLGGLAEPGRIYACWPEALALYVPKVLRTKGSEAAVISDFFAQASQALQEHVSHNWVLSRHEWSRGELLQVEPASGAVAMARRRGEPPPWPEEEALPDFTQEEFREAVAPVFAPVSLEAPLRMPLPGDEEPLRAQVLADEKSTSATAAAAAARRPPPVPVPPPPRRVVPSPRAAVSSEASNRSEASTEGRDRCRSEGRLYPGAQPAAEVEPRMMVPTQSERHMRVAALMRRRGQVRDRLSTNEHEASSLPPPRMRGDRDTSGHSAGFSLPPAGPTSAGGSSGSVPAAAGSRRVSEESRARERVRASSLESFGDRDAAGSDNATSLPPVAGARCCSFAGHPVFCCRAEASGASIDRLPQAARHVVRLERQPGSDRLGFGNVAAGPPNAPVLVVSWIRDGALSEWNQGAPEGLTVPLQSAIVSVNGISGDILRMREELRSQVVELEVVAPDRWRYNKVTDKH